MNVNIQIIPENNSVTVSGSSTLLTTDTEADLHPGLDSDETKDKKEIRLRLGNSSETVRNWLKAQNNRSQSTKILIEQFVSKYGMKDAVDEMVERKTDTTALEQTMHELMRLQDTVNTLLHNA